jgi:hypothetical protein
MKILISIVLWLFIAKIFVWFGKIIFKDNQE